MNSNGSDRCVCGHAPHAERGCSACGCTIHENDNGTVRGETLESSVSPDNWMHYEGQYSKVKRLTE